ncbi:MAG: pantoate--beta-alanine ligase [Dehalococcoidia bacterium]|nr:pantoate--beta-alanine ligase [Dehalococcoidia bacterium]MAX04676.1 pantoate--beta-alanine ligase [Dehalococcoidia bacterium]|tara:strand:- start:1958 stop:2785 length:828 start_codon:yes stop_codon:yes gene_type:complete
MKIIKKVSDFRNLLSNVQGPIGLVPTMGALHEGHVALLKKARADCSTIVASIFVNPTQFNVEDDYLNYPKNPSQDIEIMEGQNVDIIFNPELKEIYPKSYTTTVNVKNLSDRLEGASRPGHLDSVATIVIKLLNICQPNFVYFGQKDIQQFLMIKRMIIDLNIQTNLVSVETVRDSDGIALSSRNINLNKLQRQSAMGLFSALQTARKLRMNGEQSAAQIKAEMKRILIQHKLNIDYVAVCEPETLDEITCIDKSAIALIAAYCGDIRLIDNTFI